MKKELTGKQEKFAQLFVHGLDGKQLSAADCYRNAYSTRGKPETVQRQAHELKKNHKVAARISELLAYIDRGNRAKALSSQALVTEKLRKHIEGDIEMSATQVTSLSILAKISGMYIARIEDVTERSSDDIAGDLQRKLLQLALVDDDDVTTEESGVTH